MLTIRKSADRGHFDHAWLNTYHSFSFADYYDPAQMGFRALRVINEDRIAPGGGFGMHGHRDMEIVTYVISGALAHKDSLGHGAVLRPGELQHMTAGRGIRHSEFNPSESEPVHLYQIWLLPRQPGLEPSYAQKAFDAAGRDNRWQLVASPDGADGSLTIQQDASIYLATLQPGGRLDFALNEGRYAWLQVLRGAIAVEETPLSAGDAAAAASQARLTIQSNAPTELMLFDLP
jgi:redox-sensitive bicupin YhaK (pirin superfamily)